MAMRCPGGGSAVRKPYLTRTVIVDRWPSAVALIVASPSLPAVTTPPAVTLATPVLSDCQVADAVRSSVNPFESSATARSCDVWPRWKRLPAPVTSSDTTRAAVGDAVTAGPDGESLLHAASAAKDAHTSACLKIRVIDYLLLA